MTKYAVISDIHANTDALRVVLDKCEELRVDKFICLGDIVGYNAEPKECLSIIRSLAPIAVVKGNHDDYVSNNEKEMEGFNQHAQKAVMWTKEQLDEDDLDWLFRLPYRATVQGTNITIVHATLDSPDQWGYIFDTHHAADNFTYQFTQICFCGHSHVPIAFCKKPISSSTDKPIEELAEWANLPGEGMFPKNIYEADELSISLKTGFKYLINVGSVGQPRNRDPRASFAIYNSEEKIVTRYRLPYDIVSAQNKIYQVGLPERLALRLESGN